LCVIKHKESYDIVQSVVFGGSYNTFFTGITRDVLKFPQSRVQTQSNSEISDCTALVDGRISFNIRASSWYQMDEHSDISVLVSGNEMNPF
jgi:hypothetical protein